MANERWERKADSHVHRQTHRQTDRRGQSNGYPHVNLTFWLYSLLFPQKQQQQRIPQHRSSPRAQGRATARIFFQPQPPAPTSLKHAKGGERGDTTRSRGVVLADVNIPGSVFTWSSRSSTFYALILQEYGKLVTNNAGWEWGMVQPLPEVVGDALIARLHAQRLAIQVTHIAIQTLAGQVELGVVDGHPASALRRTGNGLEVCRSGRLRPPKKKTPQAGDSQYQSDADHIVTTAVSRSAVCCFQQYSIYYFQLPHMPTKSMQVCRVA